METAHALELLTSLANGTHPFTGASFPADSPYQHPDLVRALFLAVRTLEATRNPPARSGPQRARASIGTTDRHATATAAHADATVVAVAADTTTGADTSAPAPASTPESSLPAATPSSAQARGGRGGKSGKAWSSEEDAALLTAYDAGRTIAALAQAHERSRLAIEARLARYQRVPMPSGLRSSQPTRPADDAAPTAARDTPSGEAGPTSAAASPAIPATIPASMPVVSGAGLAVRESAPPLAASLTAYLSRAGASRPSASASHPSASASHPSAASQPWLCD